MKIILLMILGFYRNSYVESQAVHDAKFQYSDSGADSNYIQYPDETNPDHPSGPGEFKWAHPDAIFNQGVGDDVEDVEKFWQRNKREIDSWDLRSWSNSDADRKTDSENESDASSTDSENESDASSTDSENESDTSYDKSNSEDSSTEESRHVKMVPKSGLMRKPSRRQVDTSKI